MLAPDSLHLLLRQNTSQDIQENGDVENHKEIYSSMLKQFHSLVCSPIERTVLPENNG